MMRAIVALLARYRVLRSLLALALLLPATSAAWGQFQAMHGSNEADCTAWIKRAKKDGFRPVYLGGCDAGDAVQFAAVAVKDDGKVPWEARYDLTGEQYQKLLDDLTDKGYRPISLGGYLDGKDLRYAVIFVKDGSKGAWEARHNLTSAEYQDAVNALQKKGLRPSFISACADAKGKTRFAALFIEEGKTGWAARHDLTSEQYQKVFDEQVSRGFRAISMTGYATEEGARFAAVFVQEKAEWSARHGMTSDQYQKEFDRNAKAGYRPLVVSAYREGGEVHYAAIFARDVSSDLPLAPVLPMTGTAVAELDSFDQAMQKFMRERHIPAGTLAVLKEGKVVLARGYGSADPDGKHPIEPNDPFRIASVTKPITAAAVRKLIRDGKLTLDTKAFSYLGIEPPEGQTADSRLQSITVGHLLDHKGGWDRASAGDPMFRSLEISKALGKTGPAASADIIRYMAGQPLQFDPGSKSVYSNFGYCVLGRVIEKASGDSYVNYIQKAILVPVGAKSVELGHSLVKERNAHEPNYCDSGKGVSVFDPKATVDSPDGTFCLEAMDAHGGLIASAPDLVRFGWAYWINGQPRKEGDRGDYLFFGSLPGTHSMLLQRTDGVVIAALFNQRRDASGRDYDKIKDLLGEAADSIKQWPK